VNKKSVAKVLSSLPGFKNAGGFYFGICNREVISGYVLDAPPGGLYIWRFILPIYDRIDFLHMALGKRIAQFSPNETASSPTDVALLLKHDWEGFSNVRDCQSLLAYLDREQLEGDYSQWARYLTHIRCGELGAADRMENRWQSSGFPRVQLVVQSMQMVLDAKGRSGWNGVQELLTEWSERTVEKFCQ
jgi:hypothetical protein